MSDTIETPNPPVVNNFPGFLIIGGIPCGVFAEHHASAVSRFARRVVWYASVGHGLTSISAIHNHEAWCTYYGRAVCGVCGRRNSNHYAERQERLTIPPALAARILANVWPSESLEERNLYWRHLYNNRRSWITRRRQRLEHQNAPQDAQRSS